MRANLAILAITVGFSGSASACSGDWAGFWEKKAADSSAQWQIIEEFRIDEKTGILSVCGRENAFDSGFAVQGDKIEFGYRRRARVLFDTGEGTFLSEPWQAEHQGVSSDYRVRVVGP